MLKAKGHDPRSGAQAMGEIRVPSARSIAPRISASAAASFEQMASAIRSVCSMRVRLLKLARWVAPLAAPWTLL